MEVHDPAFMLHPWSLRAWIDNLNHKEGHAKGDPPQKNRCVTEGSKAGAPPPVFGGEGHRLISD
eukprot:10798372-Ditylum_brightwellii.AAC.1